MLEALEEQVVLLKLLGEATADQVTVRIGQENPYKELSPRRWSRAATVVRSTRSRLWA